MDTTTLPLQEVAGTFDRPALHHELAAADIWIIAGDLLQAIQSRGTAKAGLSCDQQLHYFIPLASVAAGLEVPRRWARASVVLSARTDCCCMPAGGAFATLDNFSAKAYTWLQQAGLAHQAIASAHLDSSQPHTRL